MKGTLEEACRTFPGITEEILWDCNRVFKVGGKMFFAGNESDDPAGKFSFKVADERFLELTDQPGIAPAPYLAKVKWVQVDPLSCLLSEEDLLDLVRESYELIFAKLTRKAQRSIRED